MINFDVNKPYDVKGLLSSRARRDVLRYGTDVDRVEDEPLSGTDYSYGTPEHHAVAKRLTKKLYAKYSHVFRKKLPAGIPPVRFPGAEMKRDLTPEGEKSSPPAQQSRPATAEQNAELKKQLESYLASGFWRPSASPYAAPILFSAKYRDDGSFDGWRLCCDYRGLNRITKRDQT